METSELQFHVAVDADLPTIVEGAVCFETGASKSQVGPRVYEHHGDGFSPSDVGALTRFYEDLLLGVPMPLVFATRGIQGPDTLLAIALFLYRDLPLLPATTGLVASVDLYHRWGPPLLAHIDPHMAGFLRYFPKFIPSNLSKKERGERIAMGAQWVREYLVEGNLPALGNPLPEVHIVDVGSNSFVLAETPHPSREAWEVLFRLGHLRGVLFFQSPQYPSTPLVVMVARKSEMAWPRMLNSIVFLNELERVSGGSSDWVLDGDFLLSPVGGTKASLSYLMEVFLRM